MTSIPILRRLGAVLTLLAVTACSGSGGSSSGSATVGTGNVSITLSDAASTSLGMFEVDVSAITFTARSGRTFRIAPRASRIDFVQLNGLNDLIATSTLPAGNYTDVSLTLDFATARVLITGQTTPATVVDPNGAPLTGPITVQVDLGADDRLVVGRGRNHLFAFDLDIDQSVVVDGTGNVVTFTPVLNLTADPGNARPLSTPGILRTVDTNTLACTVDRVADDGTVLHTFTVQTGATTVFQVDGVPSLGAPGFGTLIGEIGQRVRILGDLDTASSRVLARSVEAGNGVPGNGLLDTLIGHVVARDVGAGGDPVLTVRGASYDLATGTRRDDALHTVRATRVFTKVLRRGVATAFSTDAIAIGQQVQVFGDLVGTVLDASNLGIVRMLPTQFLGTLNAAPSGSTWNVALTHIGRRPIGDYTFTIAGTQDADPGAYTFDASGVTGLTTGARIGVDGFANAVGSTGADAFAIAISTRELGQLLRCRWAPASTTALSGATASALTLDLTGSPLHVVGNRSSYALLSQSPAPVVQGAGGDGHYRIVKGRQVVAFRDFAAFRTEVLARLASSPVFGIGARGTFDATTQTMSALDATVVFR